MFPSVDTEDITHIQVKPATSNSSSPTRDVPENTQVVKQQSHRELSLNMLIKELVFFIALALTTYGALHTTSTKISKHPQAVKFFAKDSVVTDWYRGQLTNALAVINQADVAFVMYYAPWDAESQYVRGEFEKAAMILNDRVHFSGINCWNPNSECRLQHNKIPSWPILMVYTITSKGILYKGPRDAHSMVKFLELVMTPLKRISSTEDLVSLVSVCDAVAVGYTPITDRSRNYNIWYNVALKSKEFDVLGEICFAVVSSEELAMDLGVDNVPNARLMLWDKTKEYLADNDDINMWNETSLIRWVLDNFSQPVSRIIPMWKKAFSFDRHLDGSPLLMLFTPMNPLYEQLPSYALMREVAMEYYNCKNNNSYQWTAELIKLQQVHRLLYQQKDYMKFCHEYKYKNPMKKRSKIYNKEIVSHNNKYPWNNTTQKTQKNTIFNFLMKRGLEVTKAIESGDDDPHLMSNLNFLDECNTNIFSTEKNILENREQCQSYENLSIEDLDKKQADIETTMLPHEDDPLSPQNLMQTHIKHFCNLRKFAYEWGPPVYPAQLTTSNITHTNGLACANNLSLSMIAVDSVRNHHFAESLGIDITNKKDMTAVVILDSKHETQYVLSEEYSAKSIRDFIFNFTQKKLDRYLRTHVKDAVHTHYFGSDTISSEIGTNENSVHIIDLTTDSFMKMVNTSGEMWVVGVCGGSCGAGVSRALSHAARLLEACGVRARAARLDARVHDLPWHYTVQLYPTIFVFPTDRCREAEGGALGREVRVSGGAVLALALRALGAPQHLRVRLALCNLTTAIPEKKTCLRDMRQHITTVIGRNLKYWRRAEDKRLKDALLNRLQHLNRVSLELSLLHISDISSSNNITKQLLQSLSKLSSDWNIDMSTLGNNITVAIDTQR